MRRVHVYLLGIIVAVFCTAYFEPRPSLEDFDPVRHAGFEDTWKTRVHIAYWEKWGSFEAEACQTMVDHFNKRQTEIFVHYIRASQVDRKSMLAVIGNDPPDVVGLWANNIAPFADAGALVPLDDLMKQTELGDPNYYIRSYLMLGEYRGRIYALPTTPSSVALFCNKEHFRRKAGELLAAGLDPNRAPRTIEELDRYAEVLNEFEPDGTPRIMGFLPTEPGWFNHTWGYYFGGRLLDPNTGKITADDPGNIRAFQWVKRYAEAYGRQKLLQFRSGFGNFDSPNNAFIDGKVSMEMQGVWFPNFIGRHRPHMEFGVAPFPVPEAALRQLEARDPNNPTMSSIDADMIGIPRGCRHPREAWKFIHYVQTEGLPILCKAQGKHLPYRNRPAGFRLGHPNRELDVFERVAASPFAFSMPRNIVWQEYQDELTKAFEHVWNWPVPEDQLKGLTGEARRRRIEELCLDEITRTLAEVRQNIQKQYDLKLYRQRLREGGPRP